MKLWASGPTGTMSLGLTRAEMLICAGNSVYNPSQIDRPSTIADDRSGGLRMKRWHHTVAALVLIAVCWLTVPAEVSTRSQMPAAAAGEVSATRGEAWFFQRCSLCHVGRIVKDTNYEPMAPSLEGLLFEASESREQLIRGQIQRGSLRMPGFEYNFTPAEFEDLMAYLRML